MDATEAPNSAAVRAGAGGRAPRLPLTDDRAWDARDAAYFLGVSYSTVRNLVGAGALPALPRIGTRLTFDPKQVRALRERGWRGGRKGVAP